MKTSLLARWLAVTGVTALAVFVFGVLYQRTRAVDFQLHAQAIESLRSLQHQTAVTKQELLAARFNLRTHYDALTHESDAAQSSTAMIERDMQQAVGLSPELSASLLELARAQRAYRAQIETFKSHNSVLKNSLYYLPLAAEELARELRGASDPSLASLAGELDQLVRSTLVCNLLRTDANRVSQAQALHALEQEQSRISGAPAGHFAQVLAHARAIVREQDIVDPLVAELLGVAIDQRIFAVDDIYSRRFAALTERTEVYRKILYGWSVVLLIGLAVAAYKLRSLYASLERRVRERTEQLESAMNALWGEMKLARKIQTALVPKQLELDGCEMAAALQPADDVGGDYYDVIETPAGDWILIGDVSGHGVPAGLVMMMCQTAVRTILHEDPSVGTDRLLTLVNHTLTQNIQLLGEDKYMTIQALRRTPGGKFHFSGMHQDIFIYRASSGSVETIEPTGPYLGIRDDIDGLLDVRDFSLASGDALLLYTDGVTEARDADGMLDNHGLRQIFQDLATLPAQRILDGILARLSSYRVTDDVSAIVLKQR
jgi:serine phosphatase RsbU (regulator of sigma subunit)